MEPLGGVQIMEPLSFSMWKQPVYRTKTMIEEKKPGFFLRLGSRPIWERAGFHAHPQFFVLYTGK